MEKQQEISALKKDKRWTLKPGLRPSKHNFGGEEFYGKEVKLIMPIAPQFTQYQEQYIVFSIQKQPPDVFCKKDALGDFAKFTEHLCQSLFFNKVAGLRPAILLKKRLCHRCFPVNSVKFLRTRFLQNTSGRLLLRIDSFLICHISHLESKPATYLEIPFSCRFFFV